MRGLQIGDHVRLGERGLAQFSPDFRKGVRDNVGTIVYNHGVEYIGGNRFQTLYRIEGLGEAGKYWFCRELRLVNLPPLKLEEYL